MKPVALFDMDGTLCDYEQQLIQSLNLMAGKDEPYITSDTDLWALEESNPGISQRMRFAKATPGFWANMPMMDWGWEVLKTAREIGFDCQILTKGPKDHPKAWAEKVEWVHAYLGKEVPIHIVSDKGLVYGRVLVDDYTEYMDRWLEHRPRGLGVVPYETDCPNRVSYRDGIEAVRERLQQAYNRQEMT